jgi:excisionase family DNA binding protein
MAIPRPNPRPKQSSTPNRKPLSTAREIAELLGVSTWTVYGWARDRRIPTIRATPRIVRFDADAVIAALEGGRN